MIVRYDIENYRVGEPGGHPGSIMAPYWKRCMFRLGRGAKEQAIADAEAFSASGGGRWRVVKHRVEREIIHTTK